MYKKSLQRKMKKVFSIGMVIAMTMSMIQSPMLALADTQEETPETTGAITQELNQEVAQEVAQEVLGEATQILAFPGAEGGGRYATGGRGQEVYIVTNLEDYTTEETPIEGSLRNGLKSNCNIIFNVSGTIELKQSLKFAGLSNITIAGQTAPGDGITLSGWDTNISDSENIIIRYLRFRPGAANVFSGSDSMDSLWGRDNNTFIIDHCSFSWCTDESLSVYRGENGTVQWSIVSESLTLSGHSKGRHGYGGIFGGDNVTFHHNLIADHTSRNPRLGGGYGGVADANHVATLQVSNNVIYNWGFNTIYGGGYTNTNFINNYLKPGPGTRDNVAQRVIDAGEVGKVGGFYIHGNILEGNEAISADNSLGLHMSGETQGDSITTISDTPYATEGILDLIIEPAEDIYQKVLDRAGATSPKRDAIDARIVAEVQAEAGRYINTENEVGGYPALSESRSQDYDRDQDGMPDVWEIANGLDPLDSTDQKIINSDGYTNLEWYLNSLVEGNSIAENPSGVLLLENNAQFMVGETITAEVEASSQYGYEIAKVEFYNSAILMGEDTARPYSFEYEGLSEGSYYISAKVYDMKGNATQTTASLIHMNEPSGTGESGDLMNWKSMDIGSPYVAGLASLTEGVLTVKGSGKLGRAEGSVSGTNAYDATKDDFQYVYQEITGDIEVIAKLDSITAVDNHAFSGIMIREDLTDSAPTAAFGLSWVKYTNTTWSAYLTGRDTNGGAFDYLGESLDSVSSALTEGIQLVSDIPFKSGTVENGYWMKLVRLGDTFTAYGSLDGVSWNLVGTRTIPMTEKVYVGFAVDGNQVANDLHNLNTVKFSHIQLNNKLYNVTYELTNIAAVVAPDSVAEGGDLSVILEANIGYSLPEEIIVTVDGEEKTAEYDKTSGKLRIASVTGAVVITAVGILIDGVVEQVELTKVDANGLLEISPDGSTMVLTQTATQGYISQNSSDTGSNVSYLLFPETTDKETMDMDIIITDYGITGSAARRTGLFVGVFQNPEVGGLFLALGFRGYDSTLGTDSLSPYWIKTNGSAGNGSPKYIVSTSTTYHLEFEKNDTGYFVTFTNKEMGITDSKQFKLSEMQLTAEDSVSYGLALIGVTVRIKNLTLKDKKGSIIYNQNDYYVESGTAPTVTEITSVNVSEDRSYIELSWKGEGASVDGRYAVEVSIDGGTTFKKAGETLETTFSYPISQTGSYIFKVYGICGEETTTDLTSQAVTYQEPLLAPMLSAESGNLEVIISWESIEEATNYDLYRSKEKEGNYELIASLTKTTYVDKVENEQPYYYQVVARNKTNESNPSESISIMATKGHTGEYVYGEEAAIFTITQKSNDTILSGKKVSLKGKVNKSGTIWLEVNGKVIKSGSIKENKSFNYQIALKDGRNEVMLYLKEKNGKVTRKTFHFVSLRSYDMVVDGNYTGVDGEKVKGVQTYGTIGAAIADVPAENDKPAVIFIRNGKYYEKITISTPYISLIGEDSEKTILYYDVASGSIKPDGTDYGTSGSASVTVDTSAQGFTCENMTIANTFDYVNSVISGKQAVAFLNNADQSMMTNVRFLGYQDTLYANGKSGVGARQYYYKCYIEGNVDFIFGRAQAVFEDCDIMSLLAGYITAASTEANRENGYVFMNCRLYATKDVAKGSVYLGRPWGASAAVVYLNCYMDSNISDAGYTNMGSNSFKNARYAEYYSYGPGFTITSTRLQLSASEAARYNLENIFAADVEADGYSGVWDVNTDINNLSLKYGTYSKTR